MFAAVNCDDNRTSHTEQLDSLLAEVFLERVLCDKGRVGSGAS